MSSVDPERGCDHCGHLMASHRITPGARKDDVDCEIDSCACHFDQRHPSPTDG